MICDVGLQLLLESHCAIISLQCSYVNLFRAELKDLGKDDLQKLLEENKDLKTELHEKFIRLHENLKRLKHDYEYSKRYLPVKRYWFLKEMVKPIIRNEELKCVYI